MTYQIEVKASTKDEAKAKLASEMATFIAGRQEQTVDGVVTVTAMEPHPEHEADQAAALAAANAYIDLLPDGDTGVDVHVTIAGALGKGNYPTDMPFSNAHLRISAWLVLRGASGGEV